MLTTRNRWKMLLAPLGPAGFLAGGAPRARAGVAWCRVDPVVAIDGRLADIFVGSTLEMHLAATGPIQLVIGLPPGIDGYAILTDPGFGLRGYDIRFVADDSLAATDGDVPVRISAFVPASNDELPVEVTFAPRSLGADLAAILVGTSATGAANDWIVLDVA